MARVVLITGTVSRYVLSLSQALTGLGHEMHLVTTAREDLSPQLGKVTVHKIMESWGVLELQKLTFLFQRIKPDLLHILYPTPVATEGSRLLVSLLPEVNRYLWKLPVLTTLLKTKWNFLQGLKLTSLLSQSDAIAIPYESARTLIEKKLQPSDHYKINVINLGSSLDESSGQNTTSRTRWDLDSQDLVCGFVGFMNEEADFSLLLRAIAPSLKKNKNLKLLAVTSWQKINASGRQKILDEIEKLGVAAQVIFTGLLDVSKFAAALGCLDFAVFPSRVPIEERSTGSFRDVLKLGVPTIAFTRDQNHHEFGLQHGENIWLVNSSDKPWFELERAIEALMNDEGLREKLRNGAQFFKQSFGFDTVANETSRLYAKILK